MIVSCLAAAAAVSLAAVDAPITAVTVYSDRARVTRTASVTVSGTQPFELPLLPEGIDASSLRVEATGAEIRRVDIGQVEAGEVPLDEGRRLLAELDTLQDRIDQTRADKEAYGAEAEAVRKLTPAVPPTDPLKPPPRLDPSGWTQSATSLADYASRLQAKFRELDEKLDALERERETLVEKARLVGGAQRRGGYRVTAVVAGNGPAKLALTYSIAGARWLPTYDIQLVLETGRVQVAFAGLVSQQTGEDWENATLTLSTAVPATSAVLPKLPTWKIGEKERFIPTPAPAMEPLRPAPEPSPPLPPDREADVLRERLLARAGQSDGEEVARRREEAREAAMEQAREYAEKSRALAGKRENRPRPMAPAKPAPMPPPPLSAPEPQSSEEDLEFRMTKAPAAARSAPGRAYDALTDGEGQPATPELLSLAPPPGYERPSYSAELPASAAGGYDLAYSSLRPETLRSGQGARRVALFSETWPVTVERKILPALAPEAFLVAELKSPSPQILPGGQANLFVGEDPAGTAKLKLVAPGESFTLPLGLDRNLKPVRNVQLVQAEKGLIGRDEETRYVVTDELSNPYPFPIQVRVLDQWPVAGDKDVEVKLVSTEPYALQDKVKGSLEWHLTVQPRARAVVSFVYTLRRPKGWRLHQQQ